MNYQSIINITLKSKQRLWNIWGLLISMPFPNIQIHNSSIDFGKSEATGNQRYP
jgi:hypothetical protein